MKQPTEPTGNPLEYRCPACGLFPGQKCITSRGKPHKQRIEVADGRRPMVSDDAPDPNGWLKRILLEGVTAEQARERSRLRKARLLATVH